jgi:SAM-dependent methyltransferase
MENQDLKCPICLDVSFEPLIRLRCGNFDESLLYDPATIVMCCNCGHVMNALSYNDYQNILSYYDGEYSINNIESPNHTGDLPGSSNMNSLARYSSLFDFINRYISINDKILDIGCATGGFLRFLNQRGYNNLYGIDCSKHYVDIALKLGSKNISFGLAEKTSFDNETFNIVFADQVLEHLFDPNIFFKEAKRILAPDGLLCISVPDAMLYANTFFFDFYWFLMREHIQHFDMEHLTLIAVNNGFSVVDAITTYSNMTSEKTLLPNLTILFKRNGKYNSLLTKSFNLRYKMHDYINHSKLELEKKKKIINSLALSELQFDVFGISREFLYLYENTNLKNCAIISLFDDTPYKQKYMKIKGKKINSRNALKTSNDPIMITAVAHSDKIKISLRNDGFKREFIDL